MFIAWVIYHVIAVYAFQTEKVSLRVVIVLNELEVFDSSVHASVDIVHVVHSHVLLLS